MNDVASAARSFFVLAQIAKLMDSAHEKNCQWEYEITAGHNNGKGTGGHEIHIVIHPPTGAEMENKPAPVD